MPGAKACRNDAPFATDVIAGGPDVVDSSEIVTDAVAALYVASPLYCAVTSPAVDVIWLALTTSFPTAPSAVAASVAVPSVVDPARNVTVPVGVPPPFNPLTVAVNVAIPPELRLAALDVSAIAAVLRDDAAGASHDVTSRYASTEPSPVTWS